MIELPSVQARHWRNILLLIGFCFVLLFWGLGDLPFYTRGEPREGLVVWEMHYSGNWILPEVNGEYIPFKPPLFHWLAMIAGYAFGRIDEFTLRLPSAILAAAGIMMVYAAGARLWGERAGFVAGVVLVTCAAWWQAGTDTQVDMTLAFFISAACLYFYFLYRQSDFGLLTSLGLPLLLGLATLAKGPIGLAVPCMVFLAFLYLRHDFAFVRKLHPTPASVVFLLTAGSWYAAALWQGGPAFFFRQIIDENLRTAAGTYGHYQPIYYYVPIFLENTLPWSFFLPVLAIFLYRRRRELHRDGLLFPLVWCVVVFVFFTASRGKRGVYILPLYPAVALLFGAWWQRVETDAKEATAAVRWIGYFVLISCLIVLTAVLFQVAAEHAFITRNPFAFIARFKHMAPVLHSLATPSVITGTCLALYAAALGCLAWALATRRWQYTCAALAVLSMAFGWIIKSAVFPPVVFERTLKPFMMRVNEKTAQQPLVFYRDSDYGVLFYAHRHIPAYALNASELKPPFFLLIWEEDLKRLADRDDLKLLDISEGRGPAGRHRLALVKYQPNATSSSTPLPVVCPRHEGTAASAIDDRCKPLLD